MADKKSPEMLKLEKDIADAQATYTALSVRKSRVVDYDPSTANGKDARVAELNDLAGQMDNQTAEINKLREALEVVTVKFIASDEFDK